MSRDERGPPHAERGAQIPHDGRREAHPIVAVAAEFVWRQPNSASGGRHKDSLLG